MNINEIIKDEILKLNEEIRKKFPMGAGKEHHIYDFEKDPSKIIKTAYGGENWMMTPFEKRYQTDLDPEHIRMFQKYPNIFPKVYKATNRYAVIEKLDTERIKQDDKELYDLLSPLGSGDLDYFNEDNAIGRLYWVLTNRSGSLKRIEKKLINSGADPSLFNKYIELFKQINGTLKRAAQKNIDVGDYNLGYDSQGNVKLLDF